MTQQNKKSGLAQSDKPVDVMAAFSKLQSAVREKSGNKPKAAGSKNSGKKAAQNQPHGQKKPAKAPKRGEERQKSTRPTGAKIKSNTRPAPRRVTPKKVAPVRIIPLGGLHEVGKNMTAVEYENNIIIIDCGMKFPDESMLGVDAVVPDYTYLEQNRKKIRGLFLTHGHEDHIGGLPYFCRQFDTQVFGTPLTIGLVKNKFEEHGLPQNNLHVISAGDTVKMGKISVEAIHVNHSIPGAVAFALHTPVGVIIFTGDWKIDYDPVEGDMIDLPRFAELGKQGVLALLSDSTNAERPGSTAPERRIGETYDTLFAKATGSRIIIASFSSNIHRIQQIVDKAKKYGRKIVISGRSMERVTATARELGYLKIQDSQLVDVADMNKYPPSKIVVITTGSQGEPMAALSRMAQGSHRQITVTPHDFIIISANPIPGNEKNVSRVIDDLLELGAKVVYQNMYEVHTSGHAKQDEQRTMLGLVHPRFFIPIHGEYRHLMLHAGLARSMGIPAANIIIGKNGMVIELTPRSIKCDTCVPAGAVMLDGNSLSDVGSAVLRDRKKLSEDGMMAVCVAIDTAACRLVGKPELLSRGFVYVKENEKLLQQTSDQVTRCLGRCRDLRNTTEVKGVLRDSLGNFLYQKTGRNPMIVPIVIEV